MTEEKNNDKNLSDKMYKFLAENSPDVLLQTNKTGKILYMSRNVESEYGYKLDEVIGRHFRNFVPAKELPKLLFKMREMISGKTIIGFRTFAKHKDGYLIPIELSGKYVIHNNKSYFNAIMRNISEKIDSEKALRESELQRKYILETIPDLLFIINSNGFFTSYHGNIKNLYQPPEDFINKKIVDVLPDYLATKTIKYLKKALKTKKIQIFQYSLEMNKKNRWFEARMLAINKDEVISIVRDITSLKNQQDELLRNKEYLETIFDSASEIIFTIDIKNKIIIWNKSAIAITGYNSREIINKYYNKHNLFNNIKKFESYVSDLLKTGKIKSFEIVFNTKYRTTKILRASPSLIYDESNKISEILFICKDITFEQNYSALIEFGKSYIFFEKDINSMINILENKLNNSLNGIIITRYKDDNYKLNELSKKSNIRLIKLSSKNKLINDINSLYTFLENSIKLNTIVIIDRLEYFINKYSFKQVLSILYKINDIINLRNALLLIRFNSNFYTDEQIELLNEEFYDFTTEKIDEITIDKDLYDILQHIKSRNDKNIIVTYKDIGLKFNISKITVSKKIDKLIDLRLLNSYKSGRTKILEISDLGKSILK